MASKTPPEFVRYVKEPLAEDFTVEIFEDLHHVLDQYIVELALEHGTGKDAQDVVREWEEEHREKIEDRRKSNENQYGALLPNAFISSNVKVDYLRANGHASFQDGVFPEDVTEIMQEFLEILQSRDDLEGPRQTTGKS